MIKWILPLAALLVCAMFYVVISTYTSPTEMQGIVLETENGDVVKSSISPIGYQGLEVMVVQGDLKGEELKVNNRLYGQLDMDTLYAPGDRIVFAINVNGEGEVIAARSLDILRQGTVWILFSLFVICLILYAGRTGIKAFLSFGISVVIIWSLLIRGILDGWNPLILTLVVITLLTAVIIIAIAGFSKKAVGTMLGTIGGLVATTALTFLFGDLLQLFGYTAPYAITLAFSGYLHLNMQQIFYCAIVIGASGAAMDIAMDVAASMEEIKLKKPNVTQNELMKSGFRVGRQVIGTMTTTLLLAYTGSYLTLLLVLAAKNTNLIRIFNMKIIVAEIMRTLIGSIGLVLVAPLTAVCTSWILFRPSGKVLFIMDRMKLKSKR